MSNTHKIFLAFLSSVIVTTNLLAEPKPKSAATYVYTSKNGTGLIGTTKESPVDNPADNIFHVAIDQTFCSEQQVWLEYELSGVQDHASVSRSVNDHRAVGGHLVKTRSGWELQQERIDGTWLRQGDNVIRFTLPAGALHSYRVRNLKIKVTANTEDTEQVVVNQASKNYYDKVAYVKGFLPESNKKNVQLRIDGKTIPVFKGEFESEVPMVGPSCTVEMELVYPDGTSQCKPLEFEAMESADYHFPVNSTVFYREQFFEKATSDSLSLQGANLTLPSGALSSSSSLSVTTLRDIDIPALDEGMENITANHAGYRFLPHGMHFLKEGRLKIPFDATKIPDGYTDKDIKTYFFDELTHHWIALNPDTLLANTNELVSQVAHFTDYINAIIKVPESPEAEAFNSTSMKGIKAANPMAAVNLINTPQANNSGSASLSYPINIPTGRNGMQPQIAVSYNSAGGNGWVGLGWNLSIPSVGIETRWGVPRFDQSSETETYSMNGEMLTPVAHRGTLPARSTGDKQFFPRIEGAFNKIIRHGTDTKTYWWEVTDKNGTRYFYGGSPETQLDKTSVLRDDEAHDAGNIARWALTETRDLNGNFVRYHYAKVSNTGLANGTVPGYQIYIDNITYTGHNGAEGQYKVVFTRRQGRTDVNISGNLGLKEVTADLLQKIDVQFGGKSIRSYILNYKTGEFYKSLLNTISEYDAAGNLFNTHTFDYYDDVKGASDSDIVPLKEGKAWNMPGDGIKGTFKTHVDGFTDESTSLSGTKSTDSNIGLAVMVGVGADVVTKSFSAGLSGGYSESDSEGLLTMIDMNGDGLQDKVFSKNGLYYRPNLLSKTGEQSFGNVAVPITGSGIDAFFREKSKSTSIGAEAIYVASVGYSHSTTTSKVTTYFTDVNGDGLPDIVKNGTVYFNHLDRETGAVNYTNTSAGTPNGIFASGAISSDLLDMQKLQQERQLAMAQNPLLDVVRMWKAPFAGTININAPVQLLQNTTAKRAEAPADGVYVSMQLEGSRLWMDSIQATDYSVRTPSVSSISVNRGDRLFFRVGSRDNGQYDSVKWDPVIEYTNMPDNKATDANGKKVFRFAASEDYLLSSQQAITPPFAGQVRLDGTFTKPQTTDDVLLLILRKKSNATVLDTVWRRNLAWNKKAISLPDTTLAVTNDEQYYFKALTSTNIDWAALVWKPHMIYTSATDPTVDVSKNPIEVWPVVESSLYVNTLVLTQPFKVKLDSGKKDTLKISPRLGFIDLPWYLPPQFHYNGSFILSVKKFDTLIAKKPVFVIDGTVIQDSVLSVPVKNGDQLYIEYHTLNTYMADSLTKADVSFTINKKDTTIHAGLFTRFAHDSERRDVIYGNLYRGWGLFGWNGNEGRETKSIDVTQLKISDQAKNQQSINTEGMKGEDLESQGTYDATKDKFFVMVASGNSQRWIAGDRYGFVMPSVISSSRLGDDDLSIVQLTTGSGAGSGAAGIDKISKSSGNAYTLGVSYGVGVAGSHSDADSRTLTEFMDMNGDRYPDIVSEKIIQYTDATGGLSSKTTPSAGIVQRTHGTTDGVTATGAFPMTFPKFRKSNKGGSQTQIDAGNAASTSGALSASFGETKGDNHANYMWMDVNGDGLPDIVDTGGGTVALNLGYKFAPAEKWQTLTEIQATGSATETAGLGFNILDNSISGGFSLAKSKNFSNQVLMDVNGDGLPDRVSKGSPVQVWINTGNGFAARPLNWNGASAVSDNTTASESANAAFTAGFTVLFVSFKFTPSVSVGQAMSRETDKFMDMNGDGFPDFVSSNSDGNLNVSLSAIGRTNLLKSVQRPLGASFTMNYHRLGNTYNLPHNVWVLDTLKVRDGFKGDGADSLLTTFTYDNGIYDRHERENYGFATVTTRTHDTQNNNLVYTIVKQTYDNTNYYRKGLLISETMTDGLGRNYVVKTNQYDLKDINTGDVLLPMVLDDKGSAFPALKNTIQQFFEGQPDAGKTTSTQYVYSKTLGNVVGYTDNGDAGQEDDLVATIEYHDIDAKYIKGIPKSITVKNGSTILRKREAVIDQNTGEVTQVKQYLDDKNVVVYDMQYDSYGNLIQLARPANSTGQRLTMNYVYDGTVGIYPTQVRNSYGYSSSATYDFRFGEKLTSTDLNGNQMVYTLDDLGRVSTVLGPYENGGGKTSNYTVKFEYHPEAQVPYALTNHFDPQNPKNDLQTSIFVDGLGRVLQTKKDIAIFNGDGKTDTEMMTVSGRVLFDAFGRAVAAYYPTMEAVGSASEFKKTFDSVTPTYTTYDVMNRALKVTLPDGSVTKTDHGFDNDRDGQIQFSTKITDANGKQTEQFADVRGRITSIKNFTSASPVWTSFKYNAVNEQIEATDDLKHTTFNTYDNLGRRTVRKHPDAGITTYTYDLAGNLQQMVNANLAQAGTAINYTYDFERLTQITYPQNPENNVKYTYGAAGAQDNRVGRITLQEDATGAQEFFYGKLGEVVKNVRTVVIPQHDDQTFITQWTYDTWNRLTSMVYPDGETVTYNYNLGGLLHDMSGSKKSTNFAYVNQLGYDKFEQRVFLAYGNGTKTTYSYDDKRRRLQNMNAQTSSQRAFMDNEYTYDKVNNVLDLKNNAPVPSANLMGGPSEYKYSYDDLYRLVSANGNYKGANDDETYTLAMSYNSVGSILTKNQNHTKHGNAQKKTTYNNSYVYGNNQPHAPIHIGQQTYTYDANGNQLGWSDDKSGQRRNIVWDEENRIRAIEDNGAFNHYVYDAAGERVLKGKSSGQRIFVNGNWKGGSGGMGNYTIYVNPYLVLQSGGYTKHFYIEGQRIVSKLGGGWDNNGQGPLKEAGNGKVDYNSKVQQVATGIVKNLKFLGADGQILTAGKSGKVPPGQVKGTANVAEAFRYFFHPDHLGSTSYITDASGEVYQHMEYFAFGETFVEEHSNTDRTPYLFNGKELDEETGLYYYGARYYDPKTSVFSAVDRFAEKYPGLTPYHYAANNPVMFVDVNGDSLIVDKSITGNKQLSAGFSQFMGTKEGMAFLSKYAAKGQTVMGHTFTEDGEYAKKNIDIAYSAKDMGDGGGWGTTHANTGSDYKSNGGMRIDVTMNTNSEALTKDGDGKVLNSFNARVFESAKTFFHESFIHGFMDTNDFLDNKTFDHSNISKEVKTSIGGYTSHYQHRQVVLDYGKYGYNSKNLWPKAAYYGLSTVNQKLKTGYTPQQIVDRMWNFSGSR